MVAVRDAATVMLVRDRPGLELFVLRRNPQVVFGPGATVFPGGAVDPADFTTGRSERVVGLDDSAASNEHGLASGGLALRVAAARECFEEAGILLARDARTRERVALDEARSPAVMRWRDRLNEGTAAFLDVLDAEDLVLDARDLHLFAHWLTPLGAPRRYNTWFFVAAAPEGHEGAHDDNELVASAWMRPPDALESCARGEIELIFPTLRSLQAVAPYPTARALLADIDAAPRDERGPLVVRDNNGERIGLPGDTGLGTDDRWTIPLPDIDFREEIAFAEQLAPTRASEQGLR